VIQHLEHGRRLSELAAESGICLRCAYRRLAGDRSGGPVSLADRHSYRRRSTSAISAYTSRHIACLLQVPFSTVARTLRRLGFGHLRNLEPKPPVQRYEWERPGELIHIDVKTLAGFRRVEHRITSVRQQGRSTGVGDDKVHIAVDDATRPAYVEVLADEQKPIVNGFLSPALAWFNGQRIEYQRVMNDDAPLRLQGVRQGLPPPGALAPSHQALHAENQRKGGAVWPPADFVYIQTLCREWACTMAFQNSDARNRWLPATSRSITAAGSTRPWAGIHLSSGSSSCSLTNLVRHNT
jgi:hypothetical protein